MVKYPSNKQYLGEPGKSTLEAIAGSLLRKNSAENIHGQAVECPGPQAVECPGPQAVECPGPQAVECPGPKLNSDTFASAGYVCESVNLNQNSCSRTCRPPSPCSLKQRSAKAYDVNSLGNPKVSKGDMREIISSITGSS